MYTIPNAAADFKFSSWSPPTWPYHVPYATLGKTTINHRVQGRLNRVAALHDILDQRAAGLMYYLNNPVPLDGIK